MRKYNMKLNPEKCSFGVTSGKFLGYLVSQRGIEAHPNQVTAILQITSPRNAKDVQKLTGRVAALNRFISRSSDKCHSFFQVLRKNQKFVWDEKCEQALQELKNYMMSPPLLSKPEDGETLYLYLAISDHAISAALIRDEAGKQFPVYYVSRTLLSCETRYPPVEKLAYALVMASRKLRPYFQCHPIIVVTSHPLRNILQKPDLSGRLVKWAIELNQFDINFIPRTAIKSQALVDFIAEFTPDTREDAIEEILLLEQPATPELWILFADGSTHARGTGLGVVIESPTGDIIEQAFQCSFKATNNES